MYYFTDQGNTVVQGDQLKSHYGDVKAVRNDTYRNELFQQMQEKRNREMFDKIEDRSLDNQHLQTLGTYRAVSR